MIATEGSMSDCNDRVVAGVRVIFYALDDSDTVGSIERLARPEAKHGGAIVV